MPRYSIRRYYEYCDEYYVEAEDRHDADDKVDAALDGAGQVIQDNPQGVTQEAKMEYCDYTGTMANEIDAEGEWLDDPEEL